MASSLTYRRLRAAPADGGIVLDPPGHDWASITIANQSRLEQHDPRSIGYSFRELRAQSRAEGLNLAHRYVRNYADVDASLTGPIIATGHQPELFHPGVWAKNFACHWLAKQLNGISVHVIIDNDLIRNQGIHVPSGSIAHPRVIMEPFDQFEQPLPYEARSVHDATTFSSFGERVAERMQPFTDQPLVRSVWPNIVAASRSGASLGHAFAQGRHLLELEWGCRSLELPLSWLCNTPAFHAFVADLLHRGTRVFSCYNQRLGEFRKVHRVRSQAQPLPNLRHDDGWTEAPFWYWTRQDPTRKPLWWSQSQGQWQLGSQGMPIWTFSSQTNTFETWLEAIQGLSENGVHIRPRALTNTLFLRLLFCDLFVHGIGGAKYDQITDLLAADLYDVAAPGFALVSQTTWLPVEYPTVGKEEIAAKKLLLRETFFHPERFLAAAQLDDDQVSSWVRRKQACVADAWRPENRAERHRRIGEANANLREFLQKKREELQFELNALESRVPASRVWSSREWAFPLFPAAFLRDRLLDLPFDPS